MKQTVSIMAVLILALLALAGCGQAAVDNLPVAEAGAETAVIVEDTSADIVPAIAPWPRQHKKNRRKPTPAPT
ncbi:MAG: hypothetical protein M5U34_26740 [Chloroflexi bacterium]|nr:hypothetical protein [Chloroflexota bacterium]